MEEATKLAALSIDKGGGPFGAIIVLENKIVARAHNRVVPGNDPTAHAEIEAIREACQALKTHDLTGCTIYSTSEPCPMCLAAIYWAHLDSLFYGTSTEEVRRAGFDDAFIYEQFNLPPNKRNLATFYLPSEPAKKVLVTWQEKTDKISY